MNMVKNWYGKLPGDQQEMNSYKWDGAFLMGKVLSAFKNKSKIQ